MLDTRYWMCECAGIHGNLSLSDNLKLCSPVIRSPLFGIVGVDGTGQSETGKAQTFLCNPVHDEIIINCLGPVPGEHNIVIGRTMVIGMSADFDMDVRVTF